MNLPNSVISMYVEMMDVIRSRESIHLINNIQIGNGLGKNMSQYVNDLKRRAQQRDYSMVQTTFEAVGLPTIGGGGDETGFNYSTDEAYISEDDWFGDDGENED